MSYLMRVLVIGAAGYVAIHVLSSAHMRLAGAIGSLLARAVK